MNNGYIDDFINPLPCVPSSLLYIPSYVVIEYQSGVDLEFSERGPIAVVDL